MKTFKEFETVIWIITSCLFMIGYVVTKFDTFLQLAMVSIIMSRIAGLKNDLKSK